jgi:hypothetical protein
MKRRVRSCLAGLAVLACAASARAVADGASTTPGRFTEGCPL